MMKAFGYLKERFKHMILTKYRYLRQFPVKRGDVVIDLGANIGDVSQYFLMRDADVYAYEPNPYAFSILEQRLGRNPKARLHKAAVSNRAGKQDLWLHHEHSKSEVNFSQASSLKAEKSNLSGDSVEVDLVDIEDVLSPHAHIRLLKIDIEGGEYDIMDTVLAHAHKIDHILLETHESKSPAFVPLGKVLQEKIARSPHKDKIRTDWF